MSSLPCGVSRQHVYVCWLLIDFIEDNKNSIVVYVDNVIQCLRQFDTVTDSLTCTYVMLRCHNVIIILDKSGSSKIARNSIRYGNTELKNTTYDPNYSAEVT